MRTIQVDLAAIRDNYQLIKQHVHPAKVMAVVKANAYGHGMLQVAKTLDGIGVDALGVAGITEALELRKNGVKARILAWLLMPDDLALAAEHNIEVGISNFDQFFCVKKGPILAYHFSIMALASPHHGTCMMHSVTYMPSLLLKGPIHPPMAQIL